jgi:hypothetical protein
MNVKSHPHPVVLSASAKRKTIACRFAAIIALAVMALTPLSATGSGKRSKAGSHASKNSDVPAEKSYRVQMALVPAAGVWLPMLAFDQKVFADAPGRPPVRLGGPAPEPVEPAQPRRLKLGRSIARPKSVPALQKIAPTRQLSPSGVPIPTPTWTPLGPAPIPNGQTQPANASGISQTQAPVSGRTTQIAVDPTDPNLVYVGTAQGGLYRSLDGGANWTQLLDNAGSLAVGALQIDPTDSDIVVVATGEANFSGDCHAGVGVYTITGAKGPSPVLNGPYNKEAITGIDISHRRSMSGLAVDPLNHNTVYVGTSTGQQGIGPQPPTPGTAPNRGLYRSTNFFSALPTFTKIAVLGAGEPVPSDYRIRSIAYEPGSSDRLFLSIADAQTATTSPPYFGGVYYTSNATAATPTFTKVIATQPGSFSPAEIAIRKIGNTVTVAVVTGEPATTATVTGRLYTASYLATAPPAAPTFTEKVAARGFAGGQGSYNLGVDIDPSNANNIYLVGTINNSTGDPKGTFLYTRDGGTTFTGSTNTLHVDSHAVGVAPSLSSVIYTGNDGGIWKTTNGTTAVTWTDLNNSTFSATQFQSIAIHPINRNFSIGGTQDNGTEFLQPNGVWKRADFGDGGYTLVDQTGTSNENVTMYHTYYNVKQALVGFSRVKKASCATEGQWAFRGGAVAAILPGLPVPLPIAQSTVCDGSIGQTLNGLNVTDDMNFYAPMALGPPVLGSTGQTVYFGTDRLYRSINQGDTMTVVSQAPFFVGGVVVDPDGNPPGVPPVPPVNTPVSAIGIAPTDDAVRMVGLNNGRIFATFTGGATAAPMLDITDNNMPAAGTPFSGALPGKYVARAVIDPNDKNIGYVVYNGNAIPGKHVWKVTGLTTAPLVTWAAIDGSGPTGIPDISVNAFVIDPRNSQHLYAGTDRGVYHSANGGATWTLYGAGLPPVQVFDLAIHNGFRLLRAATHGRGFYEIPTALHVQAMGAVSRKTHAGQDFNVPLPVSGTTAVTSGIECRSGGASGAHKIVVTFAVPVTLTGASVTSGTGVVSNNSGNGTDTITIDLTGVTNAQTITVTLANVNDSVTTSNVAVQMGVLAGDSNSDAAVNSADISLTKSQSGALVGGGNFRNDFNVDGSLNSADIALAKGQSGTALP